MPEKKIVKKTEETPNKQLSPEEIVTDRKSVV